MIFLNISYSSQQFARPLSAWRSAFVCIPSFDSSEVLFIFINLIRQKYYIKPICCPPQLQVVFSSSKELIFNLVSL
ncbi:unnamed protein product [Caenorhabditis nigoni]